METLSTSDRKALARELDILKRSVLDQLRSGGAQVDRSTLASSHEVHSHADEAESERLDEVQFAEIEVDRARLRDIEQAQERIACGRYGVCIDCGEEIPRDRMLVQPTAIRCAACQTSAESPHRR
ncbi:TraR/DksA family transcriptional regulator [Variovorax sp. J22R24]|uniref:TraR/DksA family transcriptional regulator n=1 Tax=Variovorax gracilis TaxID=3053502 RepID=UPI002575C914|nr:TraR/DksA family transcriptional regulator [Variovorax sp. J22R24]MDM0107735.1 TraR/DksA family transcriptional regulator [Variovorax sp. J22R24]